MEPKEKIPYEMLLNKKVRARLPDKLMDYLNNEDLSDVIWWLPDGNSFAMDSKTVQERFLDVHFRGTQLTSFIRSLNRWGFRRVFFHAMPRNALCFQCPKFKKDEPQLLRDMKLSATGPSAVAESPKPSFSPPAPPRRNPTAAAAAASSPVDAMFGNAARSAASGLQGYLLPGQQNLMRGIPPLGYNPGEWALHADLQFQSRLNHLALLEQQQQPRSNAATASSLSRFAGGSLGQSALSGALGDAARRAPFPALSSTTHTQPQAQPHGQRQNLLAIVQREGLIQQLQQEQLQLALGGPLQGSRSQTNSEVESIRSMLNASATARSSSFGGGNPLLGGGHQQQFRQMQQGPQRDLARRLIRAAATARLSESKQEDPPAAMGSDAALAEYLARRGL